MLPPLETGEVYILGLRKSPLQNQQFSVTAIVNAASFATPIAPGSLISLLGFFGNVSNTPSESVPLPSILGGLHVQVDGIAIPLMYVAGTQINAQLPYGLQPGVHSIEVVSDNGKVTVGTQLISAEGPGIFTNGSQAVAQNSDGTINSDLMPATANSVITVYLTGIVPMNLPVAGGLTPSNQLYWANQGVLATLGGVPAPLLFVGLTPGQIGLAQANVQIPNLPPGSFPLVLTVGEVASNSAMVSIH